MNTKLTIIGAVIGAMAVSTGALAAPQCPTAAEANAEQVRIMQTELMVAALKCRGHEELQLFDKYNIFVKKFTPELVEHGKALTAYFQRSYGPDYRKHMDKYITSLANNISIASDKTPGFCEAASAQADTLLGSSMPLRLSSASVHHASVARLSDCGGLPTTITAENSQE